MSSENGIADASDVAISVRGLCKSYEIVRGAQQHTTAGEALAHRLRNPFRRVQKDIFEALQDVSFDIKKGDVVGIIGRNGAGKSTLLKVLSQIVEPTEGEINLYGRVGSLLEVGTGFHPELTGRENIFLNGAILGMSRREIEAQFDAIVEFAEVAQFLETPVKRYSSGMYVRLAFAVAAHLNPEILVVDEVLAVGDAEFQKRCLNKMEQVGQTGRTVLFVSHSMPSVTRLCTKAILMDKGRLLAYGPTSEVISAYLKSGLGTTAAREWEESDAPGDGAARLRAVRVRTGAGQVSDRIDIREPVGIEVEFDVLPGAPALVPNVSFANEEGTMLFIACDWDPHWRSAPRAPGSYARTVWVAGNFFGEGTVLVSAALSSFRPSVTVHSSENDAVAFEVVDSAEGDSARGDYTGPFPGAIRPLLPWSDEPRLEAS